MTHSHKREIGSAAHFYKQRIAIVGIAAGKREHQRLWCDSIFVE
jgi:hypothetical protein